MRKIIQEGMFPIFNTVGLSLLYSCHRQLFQTCSSIPINSTLLYPNFVVPAVGLQDQTRNCLYKVKTPEDIVGILMVLNFDFL